jgi:hypothetical protein
MVDDYQENLINAHENIDYLINQSKQDGDFYKLLGQVDKGMTGGTMEPFMKNLMKTLFPSGTSNGIQGNSSQGDNDFIDILKAGTGMQKSFKNNYNDGGYATNNNKNFGIQQRDIKPVRPLSDIDFRQNGGKSGIKSILNTYVNSLFGESSLDNGTKKIPKARKPI